jgi:hypothetical protein
MCTQDIPSHDYVVSLLGTRVCKKNVLKHVVVHYGSGQ